MALACTVVAQSGSDGRHPAAICTVSVGDCRQGEKNPAAGSCGKSGPRILRLEERDSSGANQNLTSRLFLRASGPPLSAIQIGNLITKKTRLF
jgi:hypothetical protein